MGLCAVSAACWLVPGTVCTSHAHDRPTGQTFGVHFLDRSQTLTQKLSPGLPLAGSLHVLMVGIVGADVEGKHGHCYTWKTSSQIGAGELVPGASGGTVQILQLGVGGQSPVTKVGMRGEGCGGTEPSDQGGHVGRGLGVRCPVIKVGMQGKGPGIEVGMPGEGPGGMVPGHKVGI